MRWIALAAAAVVTACAGAPQIAYESAPDAMQPGDAVNPSEAQALEQQEAECARQGKHAVSQRIEGETVYDCAD